MRAFLKGRVCVCVFSVFFVLFLGCHGGLHVRHPKDVCVGPDPITGIAPSICASSQKVLYYLNDVPAGGETVFPYAATNNGYVWGSDWIRDYSDCTRGLLVPPRRGDAVLFYSVVSQGHMAGALDERSLHGGCPVHAGVKWLSNKWVYNML